MRRKTPFPYLHRGFIASSPSALGVEFDVIVGAPPFTIDGEMAIVDVCGPLTQHTSFFCPSYDDIRANALAAFQSSAKVVVLRIESPGGDFAGSLELSKALRGMARSTGKRLVAFTDSQALSAAYALACAADEIIITPSAYVGSIGVWAPLVDETARDALQGLSIAIVASGTRKADRNPHVPITEAALTALQKDVDDMAGLFFAEVAALRGISVEQITALQGAQEFGANAIRAGLADRMVNAWADISSTTFTTGATAMADGMKEARAAYRAKLAKMAADESDEGKEAAAALSEWDEGEKKKEAKKAEDAEKEKESAKAEGGEPEPKKEAAKAADEPPKKEDEGETKAAARAAKAEAQALGLAQRVQALEAERAAEKIATERAALFAKRPDFDAKVRETLASAPIATLRDAVANWPRIGTIVDVNAAALTPGATQGSSAPAEGGVRVESIGEYIDRKANGSAKGRGIVREGNSVSLGFMTHEEAAAFLAAKEGK